MSLLVLYTLNYSCVCLLQIVRSQRAGSQSDFTLYTRQMGGLSSKSSKCYSMREKDPFPYHPSEALPSCCTMSFFWADDGYLPRLIRPCSSLYGVSVCAEPSPSTAMATAPCICSFTEQVVLKKLTAGIPSVLKYNRHLGWDWGGAFGPIQYTCLIFLFYSVFKFIVNIYLGIIVIKFQ